MKTLYYSHPDFLNHDTGHGHPESASRLQAINQALSAPKFACLRRLEPEIRADIKELLGLIHTPRLINKVLTGIPQQGYAYLDSDTVVSPGSASAALLAVSAVCDAVDKIMLGEAGRAFCAVRPPGHHAEPDKSMGFCLFNNIAIAAAYALSRYRPEKIAIVDFDVHHGNGTQKAFERQPQVLYASSHEWPHYPGTGAASETGVGNIFNLPLAAGTDGAEFRKAYQAFILPALKAFKPQMLFISAGFDAHRDDPLADLRLEADDYRWLTRQLADIADAYCQGRIISALEGGYNLPALAASVSAHVACLAGIAE